MFGLRVGKEWWEFDYLAILIGVQPINWFGPTFWMFNRLAAMYGSFGITTNYFFYVVPFYRTEIGFGKRSLTFFLNPIFKSDFTQNSHFCHSSYRFFSERFTPLLLWIGSSLGFTKLNARSATQATLTKLVTYKRVSSGCKPFAVPNGATFCLTACTVCSSLNHKRALTFRDKELKYRNGLPRPPSKWREFKSPSELVTPFGMTSFTFSISLIYRLTVNNGSVFLPPVKQPLGSVSVTKSTPIAVTRLGSLPFSPTFITLRSHPSK